MRLKCILVGWSFLFSIGLAAQPCTHTIRGQVLDDHDRSALSFASVVLVGEKGTYEADGEGRFVVPGLCAGRYTLRVSHVNCEPVERTVVVTGDLDVVVRLEHHEAELKELEVARSRPDEYVGQAHVQLGKEEMERSSGRTLGEMLSTITGVTTLNSGPTISKPMIHGLSGNRVLVLNQGVRQEDQQWGNEHAPNLDPFSSDRITVVKGAASVQYGSDALGGVVITEPVDLPREPGVGGEVRGIGTLNGAGFGGGGSLQGGVQAVRGLGWRVQGSTRQLGDSRAPGYVLSNTGVREVGGSASVGIRRYRWNAQLYYSWFQRELGILRASHIGNLTDLQASMDRGEPWYTAPFTRSIAAPRQSVQHHLLKAEAGRAVGERGRLSMTYAYQADDRQEYDIRRGGRTDVPSIDLFLLTHTADLVYSHWLGKKVHGKVGISAIEQENLNVTGTGIRPLIPDHARSNIGAFLLEHWQVSDRVEVEAGVRMERTVLQVSRFDREGRWTEPQHTFHNAAFCAGLNWSVRDSLRVRAGLSSGFRPPHVSELYSDGLHHGAAAIERGDPALVSERSLKATLDLTGRFLRDRLLLDLTLYSDRIANMVQLRPDGLELTIRGAFPVFRYSSTEAWLNGADLSLQYGLGPRWAVRARSSVVRGRDLTRDEWLYQMPSDRAEGGLLYRVDRIGPWKQLELAVTHAWVFRQTRIPEGLDFMAPPSTYGLLGLSVACARPIGRNELRIGVQGYNLLNTAYRDILDRFRYYADARGTDAVLWVRYGFGKR